ncbi:MAG: hypothetical protein WBA93_19755 [Microcoleaceae cyanobacterium]
MNYLKLITTDNFDKYGCKVLSLQYFKGNEFIGMIECCSGVPRAQTFREGINSRAGSMEPLPEGKWYVNDIVWANGRDNYSGAVFQSGIGPVTVPLDYLEPGTTQRSAIEIHIDWNWQRYPGTAGCIGVYNVTDFQKLVKWLRDTDPRHLYVDWGLGTCPTP